MNSEDRFSDSAGVPWEGRSFSDNPYKNDNGEADENLLQAIEAFKAHQGSQEQVISAIANARLLIPLVADLGEGGEGAHGLKTDKSAELSIVTVKAPDGQKALPVFSSVAAMQAWDPKARPIPNNGRAVALATAQEGTSRIVLDPTSVTQFVIRRPAIVAIAQGTEWLSPENNPEVRHLIGDLLAEAGGVDSFSLANGDPEARLASEELIISLYLENGLSEQQIADMEQLFFSGLSSSVQFVELVDSVAVRYLPAN